MIEPEISPHVLIVEDDRLLCKLFSKWLLLEGYTVTICHTASRGERLARELKPAVVVWDVGLPDGDEPAPDLPAIPLIIATGHRDIPVPAGARLLHKPVDSDVFLGSIRDALRGPK